MELFDHCSSSHHLQSGPGDTVVRALAGLTHSTPQVQGLKWRTILWLWGRESRCNSGNLPGSPQSESVHVHDRKGDISVNTVEMLTERFPEQDNGIAAARCKKVSEIECLLADGRQDYFQELPCAKFTWGFYVITSTLLGFQYDLNFRNNNADWLSNSSTV